ncbi:methionyl-tRNA synthetase [Dorcoceras hygrometricum]|uniref:Methionyl-tRNA synthetase n=1 Tax=Dorcoceras hygrometricum TaxID=472368 RepID=A0A2Z7C426_9LAMI|nr:methionyl-tRNA synthetase [Dorcoceras hygrometricum]
MTSAVTSSFSRKLQWNRISRELQPAVAGRLCVDNQSQDPVASYSGSSRKQQQHPVESLYESAVATQPVASYSALHPVDKDNRRKDESSRSDGSAAKQLITYENWMSTPELNSNGESDKTQSTLKMERING